MSENKRYLSTPQVAARYGRTPRTIARWIESPPNNFPKPVQLNGRNMWEEAILAGWERSLPGASSQAAA